VLRGSRNLWCNAYRSGAEASRKTRLFCYIDSVDALQPNLPPSIAPPDTGGSGFTWKIMAAAILSVAVVFYFWSGHASGPAAPPAPARLPFGAAEQAYAAKVEIESISLSRAENFLHQEVTVLSGEAVNHGERTLAGLELTVEFFDELHQVVLRESRQVLTGPPTLFAPGERRTFEISFEHIPPSWNLQQPSVRVSGLQLVATKE
jgi:hypothetical protein